MAKVEVVVVVVVVVVVEAVVVVTCMSTAGCRDGTNLWEDVAKLCRAAR